ncbi:MAG: hypothetical protein ACMG6H_03255 [Acidobacteriota bacterium]
MIIAVSAPPIVDKTQAAQALAEKYHLTAHEDPMRAACEDYGFQTIYEMPEQLQGELREQLATAHVDLLSQPGDLLLNYSVVEWVADWMRWSWNGISAEGWSKIIGLARSSASQYDQIIHLDHGTTKPYDGYVWLDKTNSEQVNRLMKHLYEELDLMEKVRYSV